MKHVLSINLRHYNRMQIVLAGIMEHQGIVRDLPDFISRFSPRFRDCYLTKNGRVTVNDLLS
jgi:hypothetical protein